MEGKMTSRLPDLVLDTRITVECHPEAHYHFTSGGISKPGRYARPCEVKHVWTKESLLGSGSFGDVYLHRCPTVGGAFELQAVKEIEKTRILSNKIDYYKEIEAIARFSQQKFRGLFVEFLGWYENEKSVFLAMEYIEHGDLGSYLAQPLPEDEVRKITFQVVEGLLCLHNNDFVHRDVKPKNIFVIQPGPEWRVKLGDFGISKRVNENTSISTYVGTRLFMAPEIQGHVPPGEEENTVAYNFTASIDMWSVGVTTVFMLFHDYPFKLEEPHKLSQYIRGGDFPFPDSPLVFTPDCYRFIEAVMARHPRKRLSAKEALNTGWLSQLYLSSPQTEVVAPVEYFPKSNSAPSDGENLLATPSSDTNDGLQNDHTTKPPTILLNMNPKSSPPLTSLLSHSEGRSSDLSASEDETKKSARSTSPEKQDSRSKSISASADRSGVPNPTEDQIRAQIQSMQLNNNPYHPQISEQGVSTLNKPFIQESISTSESSSKNPSELGTIMISESSSDSIANIDQEDHVQAYDPKFDELHDQGVRLYQMQRYGEAQEILNRVFQERGRHLGWNNPSTLLTCSVLGTIQFLTGNYDAALSLQKSAAEKREEILGRYHPDTLVSYYELGSCHYALSNYRDAEGIYKKIINGMTTQFGPSSSNAILTLQAFGRTLFMRGKYREAQPIFRLLSEAEKENASMTDVFLMESLLWSSFNFFELGMDEDAVSGLIRVFPFRLKNFDYKYNFDSKETIDAGYTLGTALHNLKRYQEAKDTFETIIKEKLGDTHRAHFLLGKNLEQLGKDYQATRAYRKAVTGQTRDLGAAHKHTLESVYRLSRMYYKAKTYTSAEISFQQFVKHAVEKWGPEDPKVLDAIGTCGMAQYRLQKYELAEKNLSRALQGWKTIYGPTHETVLNALYWHCLAQNRLGMYTAAETTCREAINRETQTYGYAGSSTLNNLMEIIRSLHRKGKLERAKALTEILINTKKNPKTWTEEFQKDAKEVIRLVTVESASTSRPPGSAGSGIPVENQAEGKKKVERKMRLIRST